MKDLIYFANVCKDELDAIGIQYGDVKSFRVNTRAKSRWGQCKRLPNGDGYEINISYRLLDDNAPIKGLKETIIHELLHTCKGGWEHKGKWKEYAQKVNNAYGYHVKRSSSDTDKGVEPVNTNRQETIKHKFVCSGCGAVVHRKRESKFTRNYLNYRCAKCGNNFNKVF